MPMTSNLSRRVGVVAWPVLFATLLLGACGGDEAGEATRSTIDLSQESTAFVVRPPVTTTTVPSSILEDGTTAGSQEYVVQPGDYPLKVAQQFAVPLEDLVNFNGWASVNEFPFPGSTIQIPPGGRVQTANGDASTDDGETATEGATDEDTSGTAPGDGSEESATETIPDAGDNCGEGTHTIAEGDYPLKVAEQYDVTVEALNAANAGNPAYSAFIPGEQIIIPAKADC